MEAGRFRDAEARVDQAYEVAHGGRRGQLLAAMAFERAGVHLARGRVAAPASGTARASTSTPCTAPRSASGSVTMAWPRSLALLGDVEGARATFEAIGDSDLKISSAQELLTSAWVLTAEGRLAEALDALTTRTRSPSTSAPEVGPCKRSTRSLDWDDRRTPLTERKHLRRAWRVSSMRRG